MFKACSVPLGILPTGILVKKQMNNIYSTMRKFSILCWPRKTNYVSIQNEHW